MKRKRGLQDTWARRRLLACVLASVMAGFVGVGTDSVLADTPGDVSATIPITGVVSINDKAFTGTTSTLNNNVMTLTPGNVQSLTITTAANAQNLPDGMSFEESIPTFSVDNTGGQGMIFGNSQNATFNGNVNIQSHGSADWGVMGLGMIRSGSSQGTKTTMTITGNLNILPSASAGKDAWGVDTTGTVFGGYGDIGYHGTRWAPVGLIVGMSSGSSITVDGDVNARVKGTALETDPFYKEDGLPGTELAKLTVKGGGSIVTPDDPTIGYYALANYGGTISVNMNEDNTAAGNHDLTVVGNTIVMQSKAESNGQSSGGPYFYRTGQTFLGLNTAKSSWTGLVDNAGAAFTGNMNLFLGNGATWNYKNASKMNGLDAANMPSPSNEGHYGIYDGITHLHQLMGGEDRSNAGIVMMTDTAPLQIASYGGATKVFYKHNNSGTNTSDYVGGTITVASADPNSTLDLYTDSTNIQTTDNAATLQALNALAGKLIYTASVKGEKHLSGNANILSGLTASSKTLALGAITFNNTGMGTVTALTDTTQPVPPKVQTESPADATFTKQIIQDNYISSPTAYWTKLKVLSNGTTYTMPGANTLDVTYQTGQTGVVNAYNNFGAIEWATDKDGTIDSPNGTLSINVASDNPNENPQGILVRSATLTMNVPKGLSITATGSNSSVPTGIRLYGDKSLGQFFNGNGDAKLVINNGNTPDSAVKIRLNGSTALSGGGIVALKNTGSADVEVSGLVDIDVQGTPALANTAGTITVGGGTIKATNTPAAIRVTGVPVMGNAGTTYNGGTINVNATVDDKVVKAATPGNAVQITGNVSAVANSTVNMALPTATSTFTGMAVTQASASDGAGAPNGTINMFLGQGSTWTHQNMGVNAGSAVVGGNTNTAPAQSNVTNLTGDGGTIVQTAQSKAITINYMSGNAAISYTHTGDGTAANAINGGTVTIVKVAPDTKLTVFTTNENINTSDKTSYEKVFNNLANKIWYTDATNGVFDLAGTVKIASSLTASAQALTGNMQFAAGTGQGFYATKERPAQTQTEFGQTITGNMTQDTEYVNQGVLFLPHQYTFRKDSTVALTNGNPALAPTEAVQVNAKNQDITLSSSGSSATTPVVAVAQTNPVPLAIHAKALTVKAANETGAATGILVGGTTETNVAATFEGPVTTSAAITGNVALTESQKTGFALPPLAVGLEVQHGGTATFDNDLTIGGNNAPGVTTTLPGVAKLGGAVGAIGIAVSGMGGGNDQTPVVNVNGNTNIEAQGIGIYSDSASGNVNLNKNISITVPTAGNTPAYAMYVTQGFVQANYNPGNSTQLPNSYVNDKDNGTNIDITGNVAVNPTNGNSGTAGVYIGLDNKDSVWTGVGTTSVTLSNAYTNMDNSGQTGLVVALNNNGAWKNKMVGPAIPNWSGSHVSEILGGMSTIQNGGVIFMNDTKPLNIDAVTGIMTFVYKHTNDGTKGTDYTGGPVRIATVDSNSSFSGLNNPGYGAVVVMATDNTGVNVNDETAVNNVLTNLANKLYFNPTINNNNSGGTLAAYAHILSGLTSSDVGTYVANGTISFLPAGADGYEQGTYKPIKLGANGQLDGKQLYAGNQDSQNFYTADGILDPMGNYIVSNPLSIAVTMPAPPSSSGPSLGGVQLGSIATNNMVNGTGKAFLAGIGVGQAQQMYNIDMTGKDLTVSADGTVATMNPLISGTLVAPIAVAGANSPTIPGGITLSDVGNLTLTAKGTQASIPVSGISVWGDGTFTLNQAEKASLTVNAPDGNAGLHAANGSIYINTPMDITMVNKGPAINIENPNGMKAPTITYAGGTITAKDYAVMVGDNGVVTLNSTKDQPLVMTGDVLAQQSRIMPLASKNAKVSISLLKDSQWTGASIPQVSTNAFNVTLQNGATWTDTAQSQLDQGKAEAVNQLIGNAVPALAGLIVDEHQQPATITPGVLVRENPNAMTINHASGSLRIAYTLKQGSDEFAGGTTTITSAAPGTQIDMIASSEGVKLSDHDAVISKLTKLANKLIYSNYTFGERNIEAKAGFTSGLTGSSQYLISEPMEFIATTGQGTIAPPPPPKPVTPPATPGTVPPAAKPEAKPVAQPLANITGTSANEATYGAAGDMKTVGNYQFDKPMTITTTKPAMAPIVAGGPINIQSKDALTVSNSSIFAGSMEGIMASEGKGVTINAPEVNVLVRNGSNSSLANSYGIHVSTLSDKPETVVNITGNVNIETVGHGYSVGMYSKGKSTINVDGTVSMEGNRLDHIGIANTGTSSFGDYYNTIGLYAGSNYGQTSSTASNPYAQGKDQLGGKIVVKDDVNISMAKGSGVFANGGFSNITIEGGGNIVVKPAVNPIYGDVTSQSYALVAQSGSVSMNIVPKTGTSSTSGAGTSATKPASTGGAAALMNLIAVPGFASAPAAVAPSAATPLNMDAGNHTVNIQGNIGVLNGSVNPAEPDKATTISLGLGNQESEWTGVAQNNFTAAQLQEGYTADFNLVMDHGSTWNNTIMGATQQGQPAHDTPFAGSYVTHFKGSSSYAESPIIHQEDTNPITFKNYEGTATVVYDHTMQNGTMQIGAGNIVVEKALPNAHITLFTNSDGIALSNDTAVYNAMNTLASKLNYDEAIASDGTVKAANTLPLQGEVEIASALTASGASAKISPISYQAGIRNDRYAGNMNTGVGYVKPEEKPKPVAPEHVPHPKPTPSPLVHVQSGNYETPIMQGVRNAMTDSALAWRNMTNDLPLTVVNHVSEATTGPWASVNTGANSYDIPGDSSKYTMMQVGYDALKAPGTSVGAAFQYRTGNDTFSRGTGKEKEYTMSLYGVKALPNHKGNVSLVGMVGHVSNDFTVWNEDVLHVNGSYSASGYGLGLGYSRHTDAGHGLQYGPDAQLVYTKLGSTEYQAPVPNSSRYLTVTQNGVSSLVGKVGMSFDKAMPHGHITGYFRLAHAFTGSMDTSYVSKDGLNSGMKHTSFDLKDTWAELGLGMSYYVRNNVNVGWQASRTFGGHYQQRWNVGAKVQYHF